MATGVNLPNCNHRNNYWRPCRKLPVADDYFFYRSACAQLQDLGLKLPIIGKTLQFLWGNGQVMAQLRNFEIGIDATDCWFNLNLKTFSTLSGEISVDDKLKSIKGTAYRVASPLSNSCNNLYLCASMAFWPPYWGCRDDSKCNRFLPTQWHTKFAVLLRKCCP